MVAIFCSPHGLEFSIEDARAVRDVFAWFTDRPALRRRGDATDDRDIWVLDVLNDPGWRDRSMLLDIVDRQVVNFGTQDDYGRLWVFVHYVDTAEAIARLPQLVREMGPLVCAEWSVASPYRATKAIAEGSGRPRPQPFRAINESVEPKLGWCLYWGPDTCAEQEFSLDDPRATLFARAEPAPPGVFLQLTGAPLDLDRPEHLTALTAAYDAFPGV